MRPFQASLAVLLIGVATTIAPAVLADTGIQVGVHSGVQLLHDDTLRDENAPSVGAEARFSFELSPLIVAVGFDHFFIEDRTLLQLDANALYDLPIGHSFLYPYLGAGVGLTRFAMPETPDAGNTTDSNGMRMGLNLVGGVRFDHVALPIVRPFAQAMLTLGPIDLVTIVGGILFELDGH